MVHEHPSTLTQLAGHGTGVIVEGLTARSPWMLGIVMLNVVGIAAAVYFLNLLIKGQQGHLEQVLTVQQEEVNKIMEMHNREFDALMRGIAEAANRYENLLKEQQRAQRPPVDIGPPLPLERP
jgi:hypothetical protein